MECHATPSASEYVEVNLASGKNVRDLVGLGFAPAPDGKFIAHVGPLIHFAPPYAKSYYLMIDDTTVYPLPKGAKPTDDQPADVVQERGNRYIGIHDFVSKFFWSPDSNQVAFVDCTFDWIEKGIADDGATPTAMKPTAAARSPSSRSMVSSLCSRFWILRPTKSPGKTIGK